MTIEYQTHHFFKKTTIGEIDPYDPDAISVYVTHKYDPKNYRFEGNMKLQSHDKIIIYRFDTNQELHLSKQNINDYEITQRQKTFEKVLGKITSYSWKPTPKNETHLKRLQTIREEVDGQPTYTY